MKINQNVINPLINNDASLTRYELRPGEDWTKEELERFVAAANKSTYFETFIANDCDIDDAKFKILAALQNVKILTLGSNRITDEGIAYFVKNNQSSIALNMGGNHIGDKGAELLANSQLRGLDLYGNNITDVGARSFLRNVTLTSLRLELNKGISQDLLKEINAHVKKNAHEKMSKGSSPVTAKQSGSPIYSNTLVESNDRGAHTHTVILSNTL